MADWRGSWLACEEPEREPDARVVWHYHWPGTRGGPCAGCAFKARVQLHRFPDDSHVQWLYDAVSVQG